METLKELYKSYTGSEATGLQVITGSGSNRQYCRLSDSEGRSLIGVVGTSREENHAFIYLSRHFSEKGLPVPKVVAASSDEHCYLQTDLGGTSLFDALRRGREAGGCYNAQEQELLVRTIRRLPDFQVRGAEGLDFGECYPMAAMDRRSVMFDLNYFKYCFLKATGVDFHEVRLEEDFQRMADELTDGESPTFLYRDFQARNVMLDAGGSPWFIDFQGGRRGPVEYDVASFLWQASARYPAPLRDALTDEYIAALGQYVRVDAHRFRHRLRLFVLFRLLQVLGAYGFRGYFERKRHFLDSIPPALDSLDRLLDENPGLLPPDSCLRQTIKKVQSSKFKVHSSQFKVQSSEAENSAFMLERSEKLCTVNCELASPEAKPLRVRVFSFSYKKGIPEDESGNGGGYVFDCRSTHNPGRYEAYKHLTGLDEPVRRFLEEDGEILRFLESVCRLADAHVERYLERGFTDLMFSFGCTGGQHRSVYAAQYLAEHLSERYGIEVRLTHREQGIRRVFNKIT